MIKAVVKTDLQEIPQTCCKCKCKRSVVGGHGTEYYYHCRFNGDYVEPYWDKKNPNCPLVDDREVEDG